MWRIILPSSKTVKCIPLFGGIKVEDKLSDESVASDYNNTEILHKVF